MDRACRLVIRDVEESTRLANARQASREAAKVEKIINGAKSQQEAILLLKSNREAIDRARKNGYSFPEVAATKLPDAARPMSRITYWAGPMYWGHMTTEEINEELAM
jgi:hypothetical protein